MCYGGNKLCKWRLFTIFMAAITVSITGFLITPGYIYKHYPLVGFYHVISHLREGRNLEKRRGKCPAFFSGGGGVVFSLYYRRKVRSDESMEFSNCLFLQIGTFPQSYISNLCYLCGAEKTNH